MKQIPHLAGSGSHSNEGVSFLPSLALAATASEGEGGDNVRVPQAELGRVLRLLRVSQLINELGTHRTPAILSRIIPAKVLQEIGEYWVLSIRI